MARPTRQARRERREQQRADRADGAADRARRAQAAPAAGEAEAQAQPAVTHRGGVIGFIGECWAELQKVEWPGQKQVITGSVVVLVACIIVGGYLWLVDLLLRPLINNVLL